MWMQIRENYANLCKLVENYADLCIEPLQKLLYQIKCKLEIHANLCKLVENYADLCI